MPDARTRSHGREANQMRPLSIERGVNIHAEGSCIVTFGNTRVLCTASAERGVPRWRRESGEGWVTAEYSMLPRATNERTSRERGQIGGRTQEIQRLIGRSLRASVDMRALGDWTVRVDCDVLQADGGTRTASITGGAVALHDACAWIARADRSRSAFRDFVAAVSAGVVAGRVVVDLDYSEDSNAEVDLNVVALASGGLIEVQGTGEQGAFSPEQLLEMVRVSGDAIQTIVSRQKEVVA